MLIARGFYKDPNTGDISSMPGIVMYGYSEKVLRRRMEKKPGIKEIKVETLKPQFEETVIAEGLITR